jgi:carbonic anhydrase
MRKLFKFLLVVSMSGLACTAAVEEHVPNSSSSYDESLLTRETRDAMTPAEVLQAFKNGNQRFLDGATQSRDYPSEIVHTSSGQYPYAVVLSCIDSRVPVETIFDTRIGDLFSTRLAGNVVNEDVLGGIEFATALSGAKLVLVMGHTSCGAVKGAIADAKFGNLTKLVEKIKPAVARANEINQSGDIPFEVDSHEYVDLVGTEQVRNAISDIRANSPELVQLETDGKLMIVGAMYDISTGAVTFLD